MTLCLPAAAQQTIQFSKPVNQDPAATANAFLPQANHKAPAAFNAPTSLFGNGPDFDTLPAPPPVTYNPNAAQWQKVLEDRKNWSLMTPAQILGVPTPETILGITDPQENKLSPEERYLQRQERLSQTGITNALQREDTGLWRKDDATTGPFQPTDDNSQFADSPDGSRRNPTMPNLNRSPFFNPNQRSLADMNQRMNPTWASPFESPEPLRKTTPEQLAGMERFRAFMQSPPAPDRTPASFSAQPAVPPDPFLQSLPPYNPAGHSVAPLRTDITKPTGIMPLAGVSGLPPAPAKKAPLVEPPPWMSQPSPQSSTLPQRQY